MRANIINLEHMITLHRETEFAVRFPGLSSVVYFMISDGRRYLNAAPYEFLQ